jgi:sialic acid synthase SpsE
MRIIANIGHNWYDGTGKIDRAKKLIDTAYKGGADDVCFPIFKASEVYREDDMVSATKMYNMSTDWIPELVSEIKSKGMRAYTTVFYPLGVELAKHAAVAGLHIPNGYLRHDELVEAAVATKDNTFVSCGLYAQEEMNEPLDKFMQLNLVLLHSTGDLPTKPQWAKLNTILDLAGYGFKRNIVEYGLDSTYSTVILDVVAMGYKIDYLMRKLDLDDGKGVESGWSIKPKELRMLSEARASISSATNPVYAFEDLLLTESDIASRDRLFPDPDDFLLPCRPCGEGRGA